LGRLHGANYRREIDRGRRIGAIVHDADPSRLGVLARAFCRLVLEFGVGGDDCYPKYFSMLPFGPEPVKTFAQGWFDLAAAQNPKPKTVALPGTADSGK
jgi:hypothetical protein